MDEQPQLFMDTLQDMLGWIRPGFDILHISRETRLMGDLGLTSLEGLELVAMLEAHFGRDFGWEADLRNVGDLLDYLNSQGVWLEEEL